MIRPIVHDPFLLKQISLPASESDAEIITDLLDTLRAHLDGCVGMAANMIGEHKRILVYCDGAKQRVMVNPVITACLDEYAAEEGCLSLTGVRPAKRYRKIKVTYQDRTFRAHTKTFEGFTAQIIQHEIDHFNGILI